MDFLLEYGITKDTIKKIKENNEESTCFFCMIHEENVKEVIDNLLTDRLELFFLPKEEIKKRFETYNTKVLVQLINEDINVLNNV